MNRTTRQRDLQATYQINPNDNPWLNLKVTPYYSDVNITSKGKESNYEGRSQKTYGLKLDNRSNVYDLPLAAHNFTYGTEAYRQNRHLTPQPRNSLMQKSHLPPVLFKMKSP